MRLDRERVLDILEAITAIERYNLQSKEEFDANELVRVWCLRHLEIIGEAAANISEESRALAPTIPWKQMVGMRNILIHAYFDVDWDTVWNVVNRDLSILKLKILAIIELLS